MKIFEIVVDGSAGGGTTVVLTLVEELALKVWTMFDWFARQTVMPSRKLLRMACKRTAFHFSRAASTRKRFGALPPCCAGSGPIWYTPTAPARP